MIRFEIILFIPSFKLSAVHLHAFLPLCMPACVCACLSQGVNVSQPASISLPVRLRIHLLTVCVCLSSLFAYSSACYLPRGLFCPPGFPCTYLSFYFSDCLPNSSPVCWTVYQRTSSYVGLPSPMFTSPSGPLTGE